MSPSSSHRARFNPGAILVWLTVLALLSGVLLLGEMRQARQLLGADMAQLNGDASGLLLRPAVLDPTFSKRVALLGRVVEQMDERLRGDWRLIGLHNQRLRLQQLRADVAAFEGDLKGLEVLEQLFEEMVDQESTDMQLDRLQQILQAPVGPANDLMRLRAFLAARKTLTEPGAEFDPFLLGVDNAAEKLRAALTTIDQIESRRTEVLVLLGEAHKSAAADARAWPLPAQFVLTLAAIVGVMLLGLWACRRTEPAEEPLRPERFRGSRPASAPAARDMTEPVFPIEPRVDELDWQRLPGLGSEPALELAVPSFLELADAPAPPAPVESPAPAAPTLVVMDGALLEAQRSVDSAIESSLSLERRVRGLVDGADVQPNELLEQAQASFEELDGLLRRAREGALNMALGLDDSPAGEERFAAAERLEQLLVAGMACLKRWQIWSAQNLAEGGPQPVVTRRALIALQFELQHQLARQQTELRNLSKRLQHVQTSQLVVR